MKTLKCNLLLLLLLSALAASAQPQQDPHTPEPGQEWRGNSPAVKGGEAVWIVSTNDGAVQYRESDGFLDRDNLWSIGEFRWQWHWINSPSNAVIENITIFGWTNSGSQVRESTHIPEGWWARIGSDGILNLNREMTNWLKLGTNVYAICDGKLEPVIQAGTCRFIGCKFVRDTNLPNTRVYVAGETYGFDDSNEGSIATNTTTFRSLPQPPANNLLGTIPPDWPINLRYTNDITIPTNYTGQIHVGSNLYLMREGRLVLKQCVDGPGTNVARITLNNAPGDSWRLSQVKSPGASAFQAYELYRNPPDANSEPFASPLTEPITTNWQYDYLRVPGYVTTNTPNWFPEERYINIGIGTNAFEDGYVSDGRVIWRHPPKAISGWHVESAFQ